MLISVYNWYRILIPDMPVESGEILEGENEIIFSKGNPLHEEVTVRETEIRSHPLTSDNLPINLIFNFDAV